MIKFPEDRRQFLQAQIAKGISSTVISRAYQRKFGAVLPPQDIENLKPLIAKRPVPQREDVAVIKAKLGTHDEQLEWARAKLKERMLDDGITNGELVNLAREFRSNITTSQQIASMNDTDGKTQYVLVYGDTVQQSSSNADIEEAEFNVLEE